MSDTLEKVLTAIEMRARHTYRDLAAHLDVSEQLVQYHVEKALKEKLIFGFNAIVDLPKIGYSFNLLYFRFFGLGQRDEEAWLSRTDQSPLVSLVARTVGRWNATVGVVASSQHQLSRTISEMTVPVAGKISELSITTEVECSYSSLQILTKHKPVLWEDSPHEKIFEIDQIDLAILLLLSSNCRTTATAIGKKLNVAPSTVQRRIAQLEEKKIILGYRTQLNTEHFGYFQYRLLLRLSNLTDEVKKQLKQELLKSGRVESVSVYLGLNDMDFRCHARSLEELANFIGNLRDKFPTTIVQVEIVPLFVWKRINYFPGT